VTVLVWVLGGAGLWVAAAAVLSLVLGRLIGRAQSERDSYDELRASGLRPEPAPAAVELPGAVVVPEPATAPEPETSPIPLARPRHRAMPPAPAMPRIPAQRPQPHLPCSADRPAPRG
jgi:hypothetical protein